MKNRVNNQRRTGVFTLSSLSNALNLLGILGTRRTRRPRLPQYGQRPTSVAVRQKRRRNGRRRFGNATIPRFLGNGGVEVNQAEGGYKPVFNPTDYNVQSIDMYDGINLASSTFVAPSAYTFNGNTAYLDLNDLLALNNEYLSMRRIAYKYRVTGIRLSFDYSVVVPSLTLLSKLVLTPETDLIHVTEPLINKSSMVLSMSKMGVKNYWFNLNKGNMKEDNVEWIDAEDDFYGRLRIHISGQGQNSNPLEENIKLGILKISVIVHYVQKDIASVAADLEKVRIENEKLSTQVKTLVEINKVIPDKQIQQGKDDGTFIDKKEVDEDEINLVPKQDEKIDLADVQKDMIIRKLVHKFNDLQIDLKNIRKGKAEDEPKENPNVKG